jgi:hypothetical protein
MVTVAMKQSVRREEYERMTIYNGGFLREKRPKLKECGGSELSGDNIFSFMGRRGVCIDTVWPRLKLRWFLIGW